MKLDNKLSGAIYSKRCQFTVSGDDAVKSESAAVDAACTRLRRGEARRGETRPPTFIINPLERDGLLLGNAAHGPHLLAQLLEGQGGRQVCDQHVAGREATRRQQVTTELRGGASNDTVSAVGGV